MKHAAPVAQVSRAASGAWRWAALGALLGGLAAVVAFAPASWLASGLFHASGGRLILARAAGSVWNGNAVLVLAAGAGSRDATALPGRLHWSLGWHAGAPSLVLRHACCLNMPLPLRLEPGWGSLLVQLPMAEAPLAQWPAALLVGLGTPWNTLAPQGQLRLRSQGLDVRAVQGRWRVEGGLTVELDQLSSRVSTLPVLGSYRLQLSAQGDQGARLQLHTVDGALLLDGEGQWSGRRLRFRGQARARPGSEAALNNLLNIIGRRQGALSQIAIG